MACFRCNNTENFIFSLKYRQRKVDLNANEKSLFFVTIYGIYLSSLRPAIVCEHFIFTQEYAFAKRWCFVTFLFEGKFRKYDISVKRKHTKTNENMILSVLLTNFCKTKIPFFMQCKYYSLFMFIAFCKGKPSSELFLIFVYI